MKVSGRIMISCAALILFLTSVSAVQRLDSIDDLKRINFGGSVPTHSLMLLHWFANTVTIDDDYGISPNFDPDNGDYGSHYYSNYKELLPRGNTRYYSIGNIYQETAMPLPHHVVNPRSENAGSNRARIIIRVRHQRRQGLQIIDEVYMTQHYEMSNNQGTDYDPNHTYLITTNLLEQIRQFPMNGDQQLLMSLRNRFGSNADDSQLRVIRNSWGSLACLGLLLFIVIEERHSSVQRITRDQAVTRSTDSVVNMEGLSINEDPFRHTSATRGNRNDDDCCIICGITSVLLIFFVLAILTVVAIIKKYT